MSDKSETLRNKAHSVVRTLLGRGFETYLVGGCVRDAVLGLPCEDFDIATSATPEAVRGIFPRTVPVGESFGVVLVMDGDDPFEVATFRADDRYIDGRRPASVRYVSAREDVERRDFTVNGLLFDISSNKIIDHVGGLEDIRFKRIRTIGAPADRFREDKLRLLRAVRFSARLGFSLEQATRDALFSLSAEIASVSWERIRDELVKMLLQPNPDAALELLQQSGLLRALLPEVEKLKGVRQPPQFHPEGDVFEHTKLMLKIMSQDPDAPKSDRLALSILLHDVGKPDTFFEAKDRIRFNNHPVVGKAIAENILRRLRVSGEVCDTVCHCVENHMNFMNVREMRQSKIKRFVRNPVFPIELAMHKLDCLASHGNLEIYEFLVRLKEEMGKENISPPPLIKGRTLIDMGYTPGPVFKTILSAVEDLQLEEKINTAEEAVRFVRENFPVPPSPG